MGNCFKRKDIVSHSSYKHQHLGLPDRRLPQFIAMKLFLRFSLILIIIFITDCQADNHDDVEIDIRFG